MTGRCDLISENASYINPGVVGQLVAMILPCSIVIICYGYLLWFFCTSYWQLRTSNLKIQNEFKTTFTLFFTFLIPALFLSGLYILDFGRVANDGTIDLAYQIMTLLYFMPYGTNFFIYLTSNQYRLAFIFLFIRIKNIILRKKAPKKQPNAYTNTEADLSTFRDIEGIQSYFD